MLTTKELAEELLDYLRAKAKEKADNAAREPNDSTFRHYLLGKSSGFTLAADWIERDVINGRQNTDQK